MDFVDPDVARYAEDHTTPSAKTLAQVAEDTHRQSTMAAMLSGPVVTTLLTILVSAIKARRVVELGTFTGYSALAMARALPPDGELVTLEADEKYARTAQAHFDSDENGKKIRIITGDAHEILPRLEGPFDLAFLDADKEGYLDHWEHLVPRVRPGGLLVVDNTLWSGRVLEPAQDDVASRTIDRLNRRVRDDARVQAVMLTVRDGVTLALRTDKSSA